MGTIGRGYMLITSRGKRVNSYKLTSFFFLLATIKVVINIMLDREIVVANCHINITTDPREQRFFFSKKKMNVLKAFLFSRCKTAKKSLLFADWMTSFCR